MNLSERHAMHPLTNWGNMSHELGCFKKKKIWFNNDIMNNNNYKYQRKWGCNKVIKTKLEHKMVHNMYCSPCSFTLLIQTRATSRVIDKVNYRPQSGWKKDKIKPLQNEQGYNRRKEMNHEGNLLPCHYQLHQ